MNTTKNTTQTRLIITVISILLEAESQAFLIISKIPFGFEIVVRSLSNTLKNIVISKYSHFKANYKYLHFFRKNIFN